MEKNETKQYIFTDQGIRNFSAFSMALKKIHSRLMAEGCEIVGNEAIKHIVDDFSKTCGSVDVNKKKHGK